MPKIIDEEDEDEDDADEDEDDEFDEREEVIPEKKTIQKGKLQKAFTPVKKEREITMPKSKVRYTAFHQDSADGIQDAETGEVLAVNNLWVVLADIIQRLERIENAIGVMQEG